ncbi:ankyrin repeat-containing domain protein [Infundibulicybe gibba]|nr:ankyrin repeat-containing domain protein [Infundibulicybe gibba]
MAERDATARLRRAVKENNLFLVRRLIQRTDMRNPDPAPRRYTSLAWAAVLGHEETFEFLLSAGHDDDELSRDSENNTILMLLADYKPPVPDVYALRPVFTEDSMGAALRMARLYFDRYPSVLDWSNINGKTALHMAALKGNEELVRMLCDLGADQDLADDMGNTPLHYASSWGHIPVVQLLIERGCQYTARNNEGFTASDYAYSFSTKETLQDAARLQFELNKKTRRNIFAQAAARGNEWGGVNVNMTPPPVPSKVRGAIPRMRSGSGTSRTTATSDSGELDSGNSMLLGQRSQSSLSASSSPSHPQSFQSHPSSHHLTPSKSMGTSSTTLLGSGHNGSSTNSSSTLSPIVNRMRERDADAIEKYMRRNRSGSSSTDNKSQNGSFGGLSANGDELTSLNRLPVSTVTTPRRLRPSMSAAQLRTTPAPPTLVSGSSSNLPPAEARTRSGTNPSAPRPSPLLTRSSSTSTSPKTLMQHESVFEEAEKYTGPPSQYAQFPEPPFIAEDTITPTAHRRKAFNILAKQTSSTESQPGAANHRRGMSAASVRGA